MSLDPNESDPLNRPQFQRTLKILVVGMGLLIVVGIAVLIYGVTQQWGKLSEKKAEAARVETSRAESSRAEPAKAEPPVAGAARSAVRKFAPLDLNEPAGSRIVEMKSDGPRLFLRVEGGGPERILVIDLESGQLAGAVRLAPAK